MLPLKTFAFGDPLVFAPGEGALQLDAAGLAEVTLYESESCIQGTEDPLLWWKVNAPRFPGLAEMAHIYLAVPGKYMSVFSSHSGSTSHRLFSRCGMGSECGP